MGDDKILLHNIMEHPGFIRTGGDGTGQDHQPGCQDSQHFFYGMCVHGFS
jgi:hypothetical protein